MDKREFLKASGAFVAGTLLPHGLAGQEPSGLRENWAGNLTYSTDHLHTPGSVEEVHQVVKSCSK
ncbi:MAG: FAD-binding protein, partial [Terracidiphilus sp.]|nr:FAD-binding protein [Terracidiphilus sp.]